MMRFLLLFILLALPFSATAQPMPGQAVIGANDVLRGAFEQEHQMQGMQQPIVSTGHFTVTSSHGLIWAMEQPFPVASTITPDGMVQSINGIPISHKSARQISFMLHLYGMLGDALAGNWQPLESDFTIQRSGTPRQWQVKLTPLPGKDKTLAFSAITLTGSRFIETALLSKTNGDYDRLRFISPAVSSMPLNAEETAAFNAVTRQASDQNR